MTQTPEAGDHAPVIEQSDREFAAMLTEMLNKADGVGRRTDKYLDGSWDGREVVRAAAIYRMRLCTPSPAPSQGDVELRVARAIYDDWRGDPGLSSAVSWEELGPNGQAEWHGAAKAAIAAMPVSAGAAGDAKELARAVKSLLPMGDPKKPDSAVFPIYVRMSELRALHEMAALSADDGKEGR